MKLNTLLITKFVLVALVIGMVGFFSISQSQTALEKVIGQSSTMLAQELVYEMDRTIHNHIESALILANDPDIEEELRASNVKFRAMDDPEGYVAEQDRQWRLAPAEVQTDFMKEIIESDLSKKLRGNILFAERGFDYRIFAEIFVTNRFGANVAQTGRTTDYKQDDEQWWQEARSDVFVEDIELDESAQVYSLAISLPVKDESGALLGVMKVVLNIEEIVRIIKESHATSQFDSDEYHLVDNSGLNIYSTEDFPFAYDFSAHRFYEQIEEKRGFFIDQKTSDQSSRFFSYAQSEGYERYPGLGWTLIFEYDTAEILRPVDLLSKILGIFLLVVIVLSVAIGLVISEYVSRPLKKLSAAVDEISKGNLSVNLEASCKIDEVCSLKESIERITRSVKLAVADAKKAEEKEEFSKEEE